MAKDSRRNGGDQSEGPAKVKRIAKAGRPNGSGEGKKAAGQPENPQVARMNERDQQRDSLRKFYGQILADIKNKEKSGMKSVGQFLTYLKKNSREATRKLLGIKCLVLVLKYGKQDQKEAAVLTLMAADPAVLVPLKSGAFLFAEIWKYCAKMKGIGLLNTFFSTQFATYAKKTSCYLSLAAYLHSLPLKAQGELLTTHRAAFELDNHSLKDLLESYQKTKRQFTATVHQFALLVNFE